MSDEFPNSYKDPVYASLDAQTESKLGLPTGLLAAIRTRGEKSNHDQVSEANASTVYQIIPATRKAAIDKYGIDPYLSPGNASEVAGLLLKDSLDRNNNDPKLAVAEYVGGTNRANWGATTKAYVQRVTGGLPDAIAVTATPPLGAQPNGAPSTFDRVSDQMSADAPTSAIANVYNAYQSGQMSPEQSQAFEADVSAGKVMLPRGASLKAAQPQGPAANIVTAYNDGRMNPEQASAFEKDVKAGAFKVPEGMALRTPGTNAGVPDAVAPNGPGSNPAMTLTGTLEAGANAVTGATSGLAGFLAGGATGMAQDVAALASGQQPTPGNVERLSQAGAQALTYAPRTPSGQAQADVVATAAQNLIPAMPLTAELGGLARGAAPLVDVAKVTPQTVRGAAASLADKIVSRAEPAPTAGTMGSAGAAATDVALQRRAAAADLPVPIADLTVGQATRDHAQQQFERETAKDPLAGQPLRERFTQQNEDVLKNFDAFVDQTGAEATSLRAVGTTVDAALKKQFQTDKAKVRVMYREAEKAGEMEAPVSTDALVQAINDSRSAEATAPVITAAKNELVRLGGASIDESGLLAPAEMKLGDLEQVRKFVNKVTGIDPTNQKFAGDLKRAIDGSTDGAGGVLYTRARAERQRLAQNYEDRAVINKLLTEKRGTSDRNVALEDVFSHTILDGSLDDVRTVRRVLQRGGEDGWQAWRELQGQTVNYLKSEATKNVARDIRGNEIVSASGLDRAIKKLDADGKLDFVFGKRGAEQLRTMNDLAKVIYTSPPGSVNSSNTASIILAALDMSLSGMVGLPLPVASGVRLLASRIKDRKLASRVNEALSIRKAPPPMRAAPRPMQAATRN